ncbi:hypothetical protein FM106_13955 [Brachybacterium faecium]|nr:hypothetical protein FM106_13955 [Brachybacterium faecium]
MLIVVSFELVSNCFNEKNMDNLDKFSVKKLRAGINTRNKQNFIVMSFCI